MNIGAQLKFLRNRRGWTMQEVADRIGKNDSTYSGYETNKRKPNAEVLVQLADTFDTTTDFILGRTENPNGLNFDVKDFLDQGRLHSDGVEITDEQAELVNVLLRQVLQRKQQ
ncbi:TPA: helix-turn-helix transcriptional regulator [Bacillus mycoides]|nr:helix-turn-helix transcriptional regulator [Bacillus mycoides]